MEKTRELEIPTREIILETASDISPLLDRHEAGIFGGVAVYCHSGGRRPIGDIDVLCPEEYINSLSKSISRHLRSEVNISPVGFDLQYRRGQTVLDIEIMKCKQTESGLCLPFGIISTLPLEYEWQVVEGKRVLLISKKLLREMKSKSTRVKDTKDLQLLLP